MLDTEATLEIQQLVAEFKPGNADLLRALHKVQHRYGYIPKEAMSVVARQLRLGEAHVYGTVPFYSELRLTPPPRTRIARCRGPACRTTGRAPARTALAQGRTGRHQGPSGCQAARRSGVWTAGSSVAKPLPPEGSMVAGSKIYTCVSMLAL